MVNIESKSFDRNKGDLSERAKRNHASVKRETVGKINNKKKDYRKKCDETTEYCVRPLHMNG